MRRKSGASGIIPQLPVAEKSHGERCGVTVRRINGASGIIRQLPGAESHMMRVVG